MIIHLEYAATTYVVGSGKESGPKWEGSGSQPRMRAETEADRARDGLREANRQLGGYLGHQTHDHHGSCTGPSVPHVVHGK